MESLQAQFAAFSVAALVVYLSLRAISPRGSENQLARARLHARPLVRGDRLLRGNVHRLV